MFDDKPTGSDFLLLNSAQLIFFKIRSMYFGLQFKVIQRVLFNLRIRVMDRIRILWKQFRSNIANNYTKVFHRLKDYVIKNWGSPFLVGFVAILIGSATYSSIGLSFADTLSVYAFYALAIGVVLQLACFLKYKQKVHTSEVPS
jgi:hypothetical protein